MADRKIQVKIGNQTSDQHPLQNGCPQGSVISPILFNAIINTLRDHLLKHIGIRLSQFADDGAIYTKHSSPALAVKALQEALKTVEEWAQFWGSQKLKPKPSFSGMKNMIRKNSKTLDSSFTLKK